MHLASREQLFQLMGFYDTQKALQVMQISLGSPLASDQTADTMQLETFYRDTLYWLKQKYNLEGENLQREYKQYQNDELKRV